MEKLHVTIGFVFTQVMFCDGDGKLQFHRVMTDVDKPWESVKEVVGLVKKALPTDIPKYVNSLMSSIHIHLEYKKVDLGSLLASLQEELTSVFTNSHIFTDSFGAMQEEMIPSKEEQVEELVAFGYDSFSMVEEEQASPIPIGQANLFFHPRNIVEEAEAGGCLKEDMLGFDMMNQEGLMTTSCSYQRGSPVWIGSGCSL